MFCTFSYRNILFASILHCKKTGRKFNRCLEFLSQRQFFPSVLHKIYARHHCLFLNHTGRKKLWRHWWKQIWSLGQKNIFQLYLWNSVGTASLSLEPWSVEQCRHQHYKWYGCLSPSLTYSGGGGGGLLFLTREIYLSHRVLTPLTSSTRSESM